jgi:hypothetical protein
MEGVEMSELNAEIAKIESTFLGYEDHGILTAYIQLQGGSWGQSCGGMMFSWRPGGGPELFVDAGMAFVSGVLRACGVDNWEKLVGRTVFALRNRPYEKIINLRPLPTEKGKEFLFSEIDVLFEKYKEES